MPDCWEYAVTGGSVRAQCPALSLTVTPELGGTLQDLRWPRLPGLPMPVKVRVTLYGGRFYSRWNLNQLANPLFDGGEDAPVTAQLVDDDLMVCGAWHVHDLILHRTIRASRAGIINISDHLAKTGPGRLKVQLVGECHYPLADAAGGPRLFARLPAGVDWEMLWDVDASGNAIMDQDGHAVNRDRWLSRPVAEVGCAGSPARMRHTLDDGPACASLWTRPVHKSMILHLYGADVLLERGGGMERRYELRPVHAPAIRAPARAPARCESLRANAAALHADMAAAPAAASETPEQTLQRGLAAWKLREFDWYLANAEFEQAEGLLLDARAAWDARCAGRVAPSPVFGPVLYATSGFERLYDEWRIFGLGRLRVDAEMGLHLEPNTTMNLWTKMEFDGDYMVAFDYHATSDVPGSGTFLQLAAQSVNPRGDLDFTVSATGNMPDYNFGVRCYHFSFNRHSPYRQTQICNFRKTGRSFYLLAQVPEPLGPAGRWYHLEMIRQRNVFRFRVDGRLVLYYADLGHQGPVYDKGYIGLRNWGRQAAWFKNFQVSRLVRDGV